MQRAVLSGAAFPPTLVLWLVWPSWWSPAPSHHCSPAEQTAWCPWELADGLGAGAPLSERLSGVVCALPEPGCIGKDFTVGVVVWREGQAQIRPGMEDPEWSVAYSSIQQLVCRVPGRGCNRGFGCVSARKAKLDVFFCERNGIVLHAVWKKAQHRLCNTILLFLLFLWVNNCWIIMTTIWFWSSNVFPKHNAIFLHGLSCPPTVYPVRSKP